MFQFSKNFNQLYIIMAAISCVVIGGGCGSYMQKIDRPYHQVLSGKLDSISSKFETALNDSKNNLTLFPIINPVKPYIYPYLVRVTSSSDERIIYTKEIIFCPGIIKIEGKIMDVQSTSFIRNETKDEKEHLHGEDGQILVEKWECK
jgi:hypothetical protein